MGANADTQPSLDPAALIDSFLMLDHLLQAFTHTQTTYTARKWAGQELSDEIHREAGVHTEPRPHPTPPHRHLWWPTSITFHSAHSIVSKSHHALQWREPEYPNGLQTNKLRKSLLAWIFENMLLNRDGTTKHSSWMNATTTTVLLQVSDEFLQPSLWSDVREMTLIDDTMRASLHI